MNDTTQGTQLERDVLGRWLRFSDQRTVAGLFAAGLVVLVVSRWYGGSKPLDEAGLVSERVEFLVDINRAEQAELTLLPGIGPVLAQRIICSRREKGWFFSPGQLQRVSGIGPKKVEQMASYLVFGPVPEGQEVGPMRARQVP